MPILRAQITCWWPKHMAYLGNCAQFDVCSQALTGRGKLARINCGGKPFRVHPDLFSQAAMHIFAQHSSAWGQLCGTDVDVAMQHYGVNGYSLHAMNSLSAMYNLHQQAAQQAQHAPDYRPSVHALTLAERLAGKNNPRLLPFPGKSP
ncbi:UNVERIFIED_CONTAM: hypothetical protein H355_013823 [Colinus virginianus]|nr:hypothetical protein H355_013823 [Colinus virginianus]